MVTLPTCTLEQAPRALLRQTLLLAKPGIVFGNLISVAGGFFLASRGSVDLALLLSTLLGVALVIASACVLNNVIDRDIDRQMERTQNRALAQGLIAPKHALIYACLLGVMGFAVLSATTNLWAVAMALTGFVVYLGLYSLYWKRNSVHGTLIGSLSGAAPPVVGYCAVSNQFDLGALLLLMIFSLWQMPHAYAIGILHRRDYSTVEIPVLPVKMGVDITRKHIILYILAFVAANLMLTVAGYTGFNFLAVAGITGAYWLYLAGSGYKTSDHRLWAQQMFVFSIVIIAVVNVMMSIDSSAYPIPAY